MHTLGFCKIYEGAITIDNKYSIILAKIYANVRDMNKLYKTVEECESKRSLY